MKEKIYNYGCIKIKHSVGCLPPYGVYDKDSFRKLCKYLSELSDTEIINVENKNGNMIINFLWQIEFKNEENIGNICPVASRIDNKQIYKYKIPTNPNEN